MTDYKAIATPPGQATQFIELSQDEIDQRAVDAVEAAKKSKDEHMENQFALIYIEALTNNTVAERRIIVNLRTEYRAAHHELKDEPLAREVIATYSGPANLMALIPPLLAIFDDARDKW